VIGTPEFSTDGYLPYKTTIRDAFGKGVSHGTIIKTYSVTNLAVKDAARRYSPAEVISVERAVVGGTPEYISTSYVERSHLTLRQSCKRFARLGTGFSKKLTNHCAAVALHPRLPHLKAQCACLLTGRCRVWFRYQFAR
jgi:hypothetical protein